MIKFIVLEHSESYRLRIVGGGMRNTLLVQGTIDMSQLTRRIEI